MDRRSFRSFCCFLLAGALLFACFSLPALAEMHGDVDRSGGLSAADARIILRAAVGLESLSPRQVYLADCNADGDITAADARLALRAAVGLETPDLHFYRQQEDGALVCAVCGKIAPGEPGRPVETTAAASAPGTTAPEETTAEREESAAAPTEPTTERPAPEPKTAQIGGRTLSLGEAVSRVEADFGRRCYEGQSVTGLTSRGFTLENGGVLLVFFGDDQTVQAFYLLSDDFTVDGVSAGDDGAHLPKNRSMTLFYDLAPFGTEMNVPNLRFFCDLFAENAVYAVFCRAPGVSLAPAADAAAFAADAEAELLLLTNAFREVRGTDAVASDADLCLCARDHSAEMAEKNYYSHNSFDGAPFYDRIAEAGIDCVYSGENITAGSPFSWEALDAWVRSSGQRANLLREEFTHLGVGFAFRENSAYGAYWTQDFITVVPQEAVPE